MAVSVRYGRRGDGRDSGFPEWSEWGSGAAGMTPWIGLLLNFLGAVLLTLSSIGWSAAPASCATCAPVLGWTLLMLGFFVRLFTDSDREVPSVADEGPVSGTPFTGQPTSSDGKVTASEGRTATLKQYEMMGEFARFEHTRWTDNYRIFLTVAAVALAGEGALLLPGDSTAPPLYLGLLGPLRADALYLLAISALDVGRGAVSAVRETSTPRIERLVPAPTRDGGGEPRPSSAGVHALERRHATRGDVP
jgi:hypothetical protein